MPYEFNSIILNPWSVKAPQALLSQMKETSTHTVVETLLASFHPHHFYLFPLWTTSMPPLHGSPHSRLLCLRTPRATFGGRWLRGGTAKWPKQSMPYSRRRGTSLTSLLLGQVGPFKYYYFEYSYSVGTLTLMGKDIRHVLCPISYMYPL